MYQIKFYQAGTGDAASISYMGDDGKKHHIFIDGGYPKTYKDVLKAEITALIANGEVIDLWVVSHTDNDHIAGVLAYCQDVSAGTIQNCVLQYWYNPPARKTPHRAPAISYFNGVAFKEKSVEQGNDLQDYLQNYPLLPLVNTQPSYNLFGLHITLLSPSPEKLAKIQTSPATSRDIAPEGQEREIIGTIDDAIAAADYDYSRPISAFNPDDFDEDGAAPNGSSIAFIMEYENFRMLWTADAHPSVLEAKLRALGYSETNRLRCDWAKVVHHGSAANNSLSLYRLLDCSNYLVSADAAVKHKLPNKAALVRILNAQAPNTCHFAFTHDNAKLRSIFAIDKDANIKCSFPEKGAKWFVVKG